MEGAVMRSGERVRVTAQVIEASTDRHLWAESYERGLKDVLALQSDVARAIEIDPGFAPAHAGLALTYLDLPLWSVAPPSEAGPKGRAAVLRRTRRSRS